MEINVFLTIKANRRMSTSLKCSLSLTNRPKLPKLDQVAVATVSANALYIGNASSSAEMFHRLRPHSFSHLAVTQRAATNELQDIFSIPLNDIDGGTRVSVVGAHCHRWIPVHPIAVVCFQRNHRRMHLIALPLAVRNLHDEKCKNTNDRHPKQSAQRKKEKRERWGRRWVLASMFSQNSSLDGAIFKPQRRHWFVRMI